MLWGASWGVGIVLRKGLGLSQSLTGGGMPGRQEPGLQVARRACQTGGATWDFSSMARPGSHPPQLPDAQYSCKGVNLWDSGEGSGGDQVGGV